MIQAIQSRAGCAIVCLGLAVMIGGCRAGQSMTQQEREGEHLYRTRCAHCHEDNDLALKKVPPNLRGLFGRKTLHSGAPATDATVRSCVLNGKGMMPSFAGRFTENQMEALLAYLHSGKR